jgi:chromosomal replication initiator protein
MKTWKVTPAVSAIQEAVCDRYDLTMAELVSARRDKRVAVPRMMAMWLCRQASYTLPEIGRAFGGRHHTTVLSGWWRIERLRQADPSLGDSLDVLIDRACATALRATRPASRDAVPSRGHL